MTDDRAALVHDGVYVGCKEAYENSKAHGFWEDYEEMIKSTADMDALDGGEHWTTKYQIDTKLHKIALIMSELGEAVEGIRKPHVDEHCPQFNSEAVELADAVIRIFDYCGAFDIPLGAAILAKMEYNASRPYKHNKGA